ncbi:MAG: tetratricopeptide repeat protein [Chitinivibrionales bacterium]|nr:tetratricopeptide repeat protein [Chitinivibrionales bacterium]
MPRHLLHLSVTMVLTASLLIYADEALDKLIKNKKYKEAIEHADSNLPPTKRTADEWVKVAKANEELDLTEKALACYLVSSRSFPKDYGSFFGAARIYNKLEQYSSAETMAKKALDINFTAEASWEYGKACIKQGKPGEAKKALEKVIQSDPTNAVANKALGNIYYEQKEYQKAIPLLKKSYDKKPDGEIAFMLGKANAEAGDPSAAIQYLKEALKKKPILSEAQLALARAYYEKGDYKQAADAYDKAIPKNKTTAEDQYYRAISKEKSGDIPGAVAGYKTAIKQFGASKQEEALLARTFVGRQQLKGKEYQQALGHFKFVVNADSKARTVKDIYFLMADAQVGLKQYKSAVSSLEKAISMDTKNVEAYARLADLYKKTGQGQKAKETYEKMISLSPNDPNVYLILGQYNFKSKQYAKAKEQFVKSNSLKKSAAALEGIALASAQLNQWETAKDAARSAIDADGNLVDAREVLYQALLKEKNYQSAAGQLENLVKKNSSNKTYLEDLALCYEKTGKKDKLANADKKIISLDTKNVEARMRYGAYLIDNNKPKEALAIYKQLASLAPGNKEVFQNLYQLSMKTGDKTSALTYVNKYLKLNPKDAVGFRDKGDLLYEKKQLDGALAAYRQALKLDPKISGFYQRYAEIVIAKGQHDEAIRALKGKIKSGSATVEDYTTLGTIYQKKKQYQQALDNYQNALKLDPQKLDVLTSLGECQAALNQLNEAIITYEQVIMMKPKAVDELKALGKLYERQKNTAQAIKTYKKYLDKKSADNAVAKKVGMLAFSKKEYKDAIKYLSMIKGKEASGFLVQLNLATSYFETKEYKKAIPLLIALRKRNPKLATLKEILLMLAKGYEAEKQNVSAAKTYAAYTSLRGVVDPEASYKVAFLQEESNPSGAQTVYQKNIARFPKDYRNYLQLGLMYAKNKSTLSKSITLFKKITAMADSIPVIWQNLAEVYGKLGKADEELKAYKNFVKKEPQNPEANKRIGIILTKKRQFKEGLIYLETASTLAPKDISIMLALSKGYEGTRRPNEAISVLEKAKEQALKNEQGKKYIAELRKNLYRLYAQVGKDKEAKKEVEALLKLDPNDLETRMVYAKMLFSERKYDDAANEVENIMAMNPDLEVLMLLGKIRTAQKKYEEALGVYDEIIAMDNYVPALYEKAELFREYGKQLGKSPKWAETFYKRALRTDPNYGLAYLGLAKLQKLWKREAEYEQNLKKAKELDPNNEEILKEYNKAFN